jgi:hypothetical protein
MLSAVRALLGLAVVAAVLLVVAGAGASPARRQVASWGSHGSARIRNVQLNQLLEDRAGRVVGLGLFDNKQPAGSHATVVRLLPDGRFDTSFGKGGFVNAPYRRYLGWAGGAILGNGKIVLAGTDDYGAVGGDARVVLSILDDRGRLDTTFGTGGYLTVQERCVHGATGIAADGGGFVVVLLRACSDTGTQTPILARFTATGAVAPDFGTRGQVQLADIPWQADPTTPIARLPNGSFVVASFVKGAALLQLTRIRADGSRDAGFRALPARVGAGPLGVRATAIFVARLGRLTVTGCSQAGPFQVRYNRDGSAYRFWGGPAVGRTNVENFGGAFGAPCASFAQLRSYKLAAAGTALVRLYPSGLLDPFHPIAPLPAFRPSAQQPAHVLLALSDGAVLVTSQVERDTLIGRYR